LHPPEDTEYRSPGCTGRGIGSALLGTLLLMQKELEPTR
jgi:L-amino acid N-acyltransferase YncA